MKNEYNKRHRRVTETLIVLNRYNLLITRQIQRNLYQFIRIHQKTIIRTTEIH